MIMGLQSSMLLGLMVFLLGMRHGFDLDHLATIDTMTRAVKAKVWYARWVGFLFSLGHGLVVILMSVIISHGFIQATAPVWLKAAGSWISIFFLLVFGFMTLFSLSCHSHAPIKGLRSLLFKKWVGDTYNPWTIMLIGALFALSFDTFSQVALFSISVSMTASTLFSLLLGVIFMLGMMTTDGLNGLFVSWLLQLADHRSVIISRSMGFIIASFSIVLGVVGIMNR